MFRANAKALKDKASEITTEHILRGLLDEDPHLFAVVAPNCPNLIDEITRSLGAVAKVSQPKDGNEPLQLSDGAKEVIRVAASERERLGHRGVGTQHLLMALLICPEAPTSRFRKARPQHSSEARQVLTNCGLSAEAVEAATRDGLVTPQELHLDDPLIKLNAQLAALGELLIAKGAFTRAEFAALLDRNAGPITPTEECHPSSAHWLRKANSRRMKRRRCVRISLPRFLRRKSLERAKTRSCDGVAEHLCLHYATCMMKTRFK